MFEKETNRGEINVFSKLDKDEVAIHSCLFKADLKTPFITHYRFLFDDVFGQDCSNEQVYSDTLKTMVGHACANGTGCMFMFGQTGSGKTYTMDSLMKILFFSHHLMKIVNIFCSNFIQIDIDLD